jgi:predicted O-methyltransferase YrrM
VSLSSGGTVFDLIEEALGPVSQYRDFRAGRLPQEQYAAWMTTEGESAARGLLNEDQRNLSTRFPLDDRRYVDELLRDLNTAGIVTSATQPDRAFTVYRERVAQCTEHGGRTTYIFPEEARLLFALAHVLQPKRAVFLGSYYGYWALWALPGIVAAGGTATLVDVDPAVMSIAERNVAALGFAHAVEPVVADAIEVARGLQDIDLCVLDAEGPEVAADPELTGKAIYHPIMRSATPAIRPGGVLVVHNMLLQNLTASTYFDRKIEHNRNQFSRFLPHLETYYDRSRVYPTSEGVGIYRRAPQGAPPPARSGAACAA